MQQLTGKIVEMYSNTRQWRRSDKGVRKIQKKYKLFVSLIIFTGALFFCIWQNNSIMITRFEYADEGIPSEFDGFTIVHVSDLHNKEFGPQQEDIVEKVKSISPDIIVITGDLVDRRKYNLEVAMDFVEKASEVAPVYFVSGNHEAWSGKYDLIKSRLTAAGVIVLDNEKTELIKGNSSIRILGLSDPDFLTSEYLNGTDTSEMEAQLCGWSAGNDFNILLSHRPELFDLYSENGMDLVFSGHAHGGQFGIPGIGGLVAPDQGFFPKYYGGRYSNFSTCMFVSRGLGNSIIPIRLFNRPEIIAVVLEAD